ncbi:MAG TPA: potassium channel protein [Candidatus Marinimicrobia bacterium]|nr:potassium channel protein [Candidatus Neomarinimicrobiota bacterium]
MGMSRIARVFLLFVTVIVIGASGYKILGGEEWSFLDSIYMAVITLSTTGVVEVRELTPSAKIWTIILISFGIGIVFYAFSQATELILNINLLRRNKMEKRASKLKNHFIVCGYGRMGKVICEELNSQKLDFLIVENNNEKITIISELGYVFIEGDATADETLEKSHIDQAQGLVAVLSNDSDNLFVTMTARTLNPDLFITSRCSLDQNVSKMKRAGANKVINPYVAGGHKMAELLITPYVEDTVEIASPKHNIDLLIEEINLKTITQFHVVTIRESNIRENFQLLIVGSFDDEGETTLNPDPDYTMSKDNTLLLLGEKESLLRFKQSIVMKPSP